MAPPEVRSINSVIFGHDSAQMPACAPGGSRSFKREGLAGGGSQTRAGEDRALDEARQLARSQNWARNERSMSGNYARDRCFCSKNTRPLCETCAWFAKDTHPTLSPFGASVGDRCGSQNRYWHSLLENRCLTPR